MYEYKLHIKIRVVFLKFFTEFNKIIILYNCINHNNKSFQKICKIYFFLQQEQLRIRIQL